MSAGYCPGYCAHGVEHAGTCVDPAAIVSDADQLAALKLHVTHLIYAIDRGYFSDSFLPQSAFVESLGPYADPSFKPIVESTPTT